MGVERRELPDGFALEHALGRLEVHELAPGVIFQDYYGQVIFDYFPPVAEFARELLASGRRLAFVSDISRVHASPTDYRRAWATWFKDHDASIDEIVVLLSGPLTRLAVQTANVITGGTIKPYSDLEQFQAQIERIVVQRWKDEPAAQLSPDPSVADSADVEIDRASLPRSLEIPRIEAFKSPVARELGLAALEHELFGRDETRDARWPTLGRFRVLRKMGEGGMGMVFACHDEELDREVAVKLLHANPDERASERIGREARAMARLTHPNVARVYEIGRNGDTPFLVMELVDGQTLNDWLSARPRNTLEISGVFADAARGLQAAHAESIVHRDFKPHNVMIGRDGRVIVMDFGLARGIAHERLSVPDQESSFEDLTATGVIVGTPAYMAPEQFLGHKATEASDQFGFCVALWEALYRRRPFEASTPVALAQAVLTQTPRTSEREIPAPLEHVLRRGLRADPALRWPSMQPIVDALELESHSAVK